MEPRGDGMYTYVPTQLFPHIRNEALLRKMTALAIRRSQLMSATEHNDTVDALEWAGEHVGFIIDASNGTFNITLHPEGALLFSSRWFLLIVRCPLSPWPLLVKKSVHCCWE